MEPEHRTIETHVKIIDADNKTVPVADWDVSFGLRTLLVQIRGPVNAPPPTAEPKESTLYVVVDRDGELRTKTLRSLLTLEQARTFCEQDGHGPHSIIPLTFFLEEIRDIQVSKLIATRFAAKQAEDA